MDLYPAMIEISDSDDVSMIQGHHFQIRMVLIVNSMNWLYQELGAKI